MWVYAAADYTMVVFLAGFVVVAVFLLALIIAQEKIR